MPAPERVEGAAMIFKSAGAVRAVFDVDVEDPFEQSGPTHARRFSLTLGVIGRELGGTLGWSGNDFTAQLRVGRQHAVGSAQSATFREFSKRRNETITSLRCLIGTSSLIWISRNPASIWLRLLLGKSSARRP